MARVLLAVTEGLSREFARLLEGEGLELVFARDGQELVDLARETHPALIILERELPVLDGLSALLLLKNDEATRDIPIVALCDHRCTREQAELARDAGCDAHLSLPLNEAKLRKILKNFLAR